MGIGPTALRLYERLLTSGHLKSGMSVCELGAQDFVPKGHSLALARCVHNGNGARQFYEYLGMSYVCIDLNGEYGALQLDLNTAAWHGDHQFDVVTNHGTSEHIFNQENCFRIIHDLTKPGGLMIHVIPTRGYHRHGFFTVSSLLFEELERANGYAVVVRYEEADRSGSLLVAALTRTSDAEFVVPMQTRYGASVPEEKPDA